VFNFDYPKVKYSLVRIALQDSYPAWFIDTRGIIRGANLMAFWLSGNMKFSEPIKSDALLGKSMFHIIMSNFHRVPVGKNIECYSKKSSMIKRMKANSNVELPVYENFVTAMKRDPLLEKIYEEAPFYPDKEWEHPLYMMFPENIGTSQLLEFQMTLFRLEGDAGFLAMCTPTRSSLSDIEKQYGLLVEEYGDDAYVQLDDVSLDNLEINQLPSTFESHFRPYYPSLIQNPLWYIIDENKAHRLLVGSPTVGAHFFELFFAPQLRDWMGPIQETSAPRAIKYFTVFTSTFLDEKHEFHAAYEETMARLMQQQDFRYALEVSRKLPIRLFIPDNADTPFYTCRVILPWAISPQISLQFRSMVKILHRNRMVHSDIRDYQVTLVPENYETEVALILLHVQSASKNLYGDNSGSIPTLKQFLWLLNVMRTVKEGLSPGDEEEDASWQPESAFARIYDKLTVEFSEHASDRTDMIIAEFREIIEELYRKEIVDYVSVLEMLYDLTGTLRFMDQLSDFLRVEIKSNKSDETMWE